MFIKLGRTVNYTELNMPIFKIFLQILRCALPPNFNINWRFFWTTLTELKSIYLHPSEGLIAMKVLVRWKLLTLFFQKMMVILSCNTFSFKDYFEFVIRYEYIDQGMKKLLHIFLKTCILVFASHYPINYQNCFSMLTMLANHVNAEICAGVISSKHQIVEYIAETYLYRRLFANPGFAFFIISTECVCITWL